MDRRRSAFALITALVTASAVFAAALTLAALSRAAVIESGALSRALESELRARTAAARAVAGVVGESITASGDVAPDDPSSPDGPTVDTDDLPEMPEFLREFLEGMLDEEPEEENTEGAPQNESRSARSTERASAHLKARGLPPTAVRVEVDGAQFNVSITDALGLINLNKADAEILENLFTIAGAEPIIASALAAQLIDYRDEDDFTTPRGAEARDYLRRGFTISNAPLESPRELLYLPDMTPALFRAVEPLVTTAGDGKLHAPSAPEAAMAAIPGVGESGARAIAALRESGSLDADSLQDALSLFAQDAASQFRFRPSPVLRVRVEPLSPGPTFTALVAVTDEGLRWSAFQTD